MEQPQETTPVQAPAPGQPGQPGAPAPETTPTQFHPHCVLNMLQLPKIPTPLDHYNGCSQDMHHFMHFTDNAYAILVNQSDEDVMRLHSSMFTQRLTATWSSKGINAEFITMWRKDHSVTSSSSMTTALHLSYDVTSQSWSTSSSSIHVIHLWTFNTSSSFLTSTTDSKCTFFFLWI